MRTITLIESKLTCVKQVIYCRISNDFVKVQMTIPLQDFLVSLLVRIKIYKTTLITSFLHPGFHASSSASSSFSLHQVSKLVLSNVLRSSSTKRKSHLSRKRSSTRTRRTVFFSKQSTSSFIWTMTPFVHFLSERQTNSGNF